MLRLCNFSLFLFTALVVTEPMLHAGSNSGNEGCRSGSGGSRSSEGNDQYASSQGSGSSSGSSSDRGASGVHSGSYAPRETSSAPSNRFDRAIKALSVNASIDGSYTVYVLATNFNSEDEYHTLIFRMNKLVDYFIYGDLPSNFHEVAYDDPENGGYDMAIMYVDDPDLAGEATPKLKQKVSAWLRSKVKPVPRLQTNNSAP